MPPTDKQLALIQVIEETLDIRFEGRTKHDAWLWTKENSPVMHNLQSGAVTEKQLVAIGNVQRVLGVAFDGETKEDARTWLSEHMPLAVVKLAQQEMEEDAKALRRASSTQVIPYSIHPDREKLAYMDLVDSFDEYPSLETLNMQIGILKLGLHAF